MSFQVAPKWNLTIRLRYDRGIEQAGVPVSFDLFGGRAAIVWEI